MDISVIIPLYNEDESIPELYAWIERVMSANGFTYEVIFINDGSTDHSWDIITKLHSQQPDKVKGIKFRRNYGKSPALYCGFAQAQGDVVITMDADLQDSPDEIPELYRMVKEEGYDLVSGYKQKRYDPLSKRLPTKLFNATARKISGIHNLHDFNCGLKAYRQAVVKNIEVYGEMHRYIPYLAKQAGFTKIGEKVVHHQARKYGESKFMGWNRFVNGYLDLLTLWFLSTFGKKPMHVFGFLGTIMFLIGFVAAFIIGADKLWCLANHIPQRLVTDSPFFYISLTMMMMGTQLFLTGFIGDLISRSSTGRNDYQIEESLPDSPHHTKPAANRLLTMLMPLLLAAGGVGLSSCTSIDCPVQNTIRTYYALQKPDLTPDTLKDTLFVTSIKANGDTTLLRAYINKSTFSLPIGYTTHEDTLFFHFQNSPYYAVDTVWVKKDNIAHFESVDCSPAYFHHISGVRHTCHAIDSLIINNATVDYDPQTIHFHLYLKSSH